MSRLIVLLVIIIVLPCYAFCMILDVEADRIEKSEGMVDAQGNVVITGEDMSLEANFVVYDVVNGDIWATGDCHLKEKIGEIKASTLYYNVIRKDAHIEDGSILIYKEPIRVMGSSITRYGHDLYTGEGVMYTPCLGEVPAWSIKTSRIKIPIEGYGSASHARFMIHGHPVFYAPYLLYPAKLKRQSGLLFPEIGHSTDTGYRFSQPIYLVTSRWSDITITPTYLSKRGLLMSSEFRYRLSYTTKGEVYVESIHDKKGGEVMEGGILDEIPRNRWFLKAKHNGNNLTWDINFVSDEDYLEDIGTLYDENDIWGGGNTSDEEELISRMEWTSSGKGFTLGISGQWKQDLTIKGDDKTIQQLPKLQARMGQKDIPLTPIRCSADLSSTRLYSKEWIEGLRDYGAVEFSLPVSLDPYITIRPWLKEIYRDTIFSDNDTYEKDMYKEHWQERGVSLSTTLYSSRTSFGWYHQVVPETSWTYKSRYGGNYDKNDPLDIFPGLLSGDDWEKLYDMDVSIVNFIRDDKGSPILEFRLGRKYSYISKEWDLIESTIKFSPCSWFSVEHRNKFGRMPLRPYATHEHSTTLNIADNRGDEITLGQEYNRQDTKCIIIGAKANLGMGFSARAEIRHDYMTRRYEYLRQGLSYTSQCWGVDIYRDVEPSDDDRPRETTIYFKINLLGLGDVIHTSYSVDDRR